MSGSVLYVSYLRIRVKGLRDWAAGLSLFFFLSFLLYIPGGFLLSLPFPIYPHLRSRLFFIPSASSSPAQFFPLCCFSS